MPHFSKPLCRPPDADRYRLASAGGRGPGRCGRAARAQGRGTSRSLRDQRVTQTARGGDDAAARRMVTPGRPRRGAGGRRRGRARPGTPKRWRISAARSELASKANRVKQELARKPRKGEKELDDLRRRLAARADRLAVRGLAARGRAGDLPRWLLVASVVWNILPFHVGCR